MALVTKSPSINEYEDFRHAACGLVTEVGEIIDQYKRHWFYKKDLDKKNLAEEIGDVLWYLAIGYYALGIEIEEDPSEALAETTRPEMDMILAKLVRYSSNVFSVAFAYPLEAMESNLDYDLRQLMYFLHYFAEEQGTSIMEAATANVRKLAKRYPDGFSSFHALNRNKEHELSHIEG